MQFKFFKHTLYICLALQGYRAEGVTREKYKHSRIDAQHILKIEEIRSLGSFYDELYTSIEGNLHKILGPS
jgi:hypothetical protein